MKAVAAKWGFLPLAHRIKVYCFFDNPVLRLPIVRTIKACFFDANPFLGFYRFHFGAPKQFVLMTGTMRSGSTLLKALLAEADDVSHLLEVEFGHYPLIWPELTLWCFYSLSNKPIIVLKRPAQFDIYNHIPFENSFVRLKIIITLRNPYDTILSLKNAYKGSKTYPELAEYWCRSMEMILDDKRLLSHDVLFSKYEDLVKEPVAQTEKIFKFINSRRTEGVRTYTASTTFKKFKLGRDDGFGKIKTGEVQEVKNKVFDEELLELLKNNQRLLKLSERLGYSEHEALGEIDNATA